MTTMYCPHCRRNVDVSRWTGGRVLILIILLILGVILGIIYLIYVCSITEKCPYCNTPALQMEAPASDLPTVPQPPPALRRIPSTAPSAEQPTGAAPSSAAAAVPV